MSKLTPHEVKDCLVESACEEQRINGKMPTPYEAGSYFEQIMARLDKAESKPKTSGVERKERKIEEEAKKRAARAGFTIDGNWEITERPLALGGDQYVVKQETAMAKLMRHRLRLLRSKPDWRVKLERINPFALQGKLGFEKQQHALELVRGVIRDSNTVFGDWWKAKPKKLWSYTGQASRG